MTDMKTVRQLAVWLADAGIDELELTGPTTRLRLRRDGSSAEPAVAPSGNPSASIASAKAPSTLINAASVGVFLDRHPLRDAPIAAVGTRVSAGQVVGLLRIGQFLLPVAAHRDGAVARVLVPHDSTVGFGTPLIELAD